MYPDIPLLYFRKRVRMDLEGHRAIRDEFTLNVRIVTEAYDQIIP
jgi:hypothetical protein